MKWKWAPGQEWVSTDGKCRVAFDKTSSRFCVYRITDNHHWHAARNGFTSSHDARVWADVWVDACYNKSQKPRVTIE